VSAQCRAGVVDATVGAGLQNDCNFRKDNGRGVRHVCKQFVTLCGKLNLLSPSTVVIDGSKFKGVNNRDRNYTTGKLKRRREELEHSIERYFYRLDRMDQKAPDVVEIQAPALKEKLASLAHSGRVAQALWGTTCSQRLNPITI